MSNVSVDFERMFSYVAFGLKNKLGMLNPEDYKKGLLLRQGINMYCALALKRSVKTGDNLDKFLSSFSETKMIYSVFTRPVKEWFLGWNEAIIAQLEECDFYEIGALINVNKVSKAYSLTDECYDYLDASEKDLTAIDEKAVYNQMKNLPQEVYVSVRKFIIEHRLLTNTERKKFILAHENNEEIRKIIENSYENIPQGMYECPNCGWTLQFVGEQPVCCHHSCIDVAIAKRDKLHQIDTKYEYRLRKGVARYISYPGDAELEIDNVCKQLGLKSQLWPDHDKYDIGITFNDGTYWGVDAKTYKNPKFLGRQIAVDNIFQSANIDRGFYVIPDSIVKNTAKYIEICKSYLKNSKFTCLSMSQFKAKLRRRNRNA